MSVRIICTVTTDLNYDQRMQRICTTLQEAGYDVLLVGRQKKTSTSLTPQSFEQHRLKCFFERGMLFYIEFTCRLFLYLCLKRADVHCAVDLDTILPGFLVGRLRGRKVVYDAHEYFTEVPELVQRPKVQAIWKTIERLTVPRVDAAYTVGAGLAGLFQTQYPQTRFSVVRNVPFATTAPQAIPPRPPFILLYQGALNDGRGLEEMLTALVDVREEVVFWLAGEGDLSSSLREQAEALGLSTRVKFLGYVKPKALKELTQQAHVGINVLQPKGLNYYYSLANKFFDYIQAGKPSINSNFPEYQALNATYNVADLVDDLTPTTLIKAIERLATDTAHYEQLHQNCIKAAPKLTWEQEAETLRAIYKELFDA